MIDGHTHLFGLIGSPVEHSLSPAMHNAAFEALGLNYRYVPLPVAPGQVDSAVKGLVALGFHGANVTVPHKQAALAASDCASASAQALGAANTLVIERRDDGSASVAAHNTDVDGFTVALRSGGYDFAAGGGSVVVGAGGAARAVVYGLLSLGEGDIVILNRTVERARTLIADLGECPAWSGRLRALPLTPETIVESTSEAGLLVNATTIGMWPDTAGSIWPRGVPLPPGQTVFDLVYNPLETRLLRQARASGGIVIDGLEMLVQQGALAFAMWTGERFDLDEVATVMRTACRQKLQA